MKNIYRVGSALGLAVLVAGCTPQQQAQVNATTKVAEQGANVALSKTAKVARDSGVSSRIKGALLASGQLDSSGIGVSTDNKKIFMTGYVPNAKQKQLAHQIAEHTKDPGFLIVDQVVVHHAPKAH